LVRYNFREKAFLKYMAIWVRLKWTDKMICPSWTNPFICVDIILIKSDGWDFKLGTCCWLGHKTGAYVYMCTYDSFGLGRIYGLKCGFFGRIYGPDLGFFLAGFNVLDLLQGPSFFWVGIDYFFIWISKICYFIWISGGTG
jgi:hypothetical protein